MRGEWILPYPLGMPRSVNTEGTRRGSSSRHSQAETFFFDDIPIEANLIRVVVLLEVEDGRNGNDGST